MWNFIDRVLTTDLNDESVLPRFKSLMRNKTFKDVKDWTLISAYCVFLCILLLECLS